MREGEVGGRDGGGSEKERVMESEREMGGGVREGGGGEKAQ